jgi:hypothetical protein
MGQQINKGETITGVPRASGAQSISDTWVRLVPYDLVDPYKGFSEQEALRLIDALLARDYIMVDETNKPGEPRSYKATEEGPSLGCATGSKPV